MVPVRRLGVVAAALGMSACGGSEAPSTPLTKAAASVQIIDGDGQQGFVGEMLANPVNVQIVDSSSSAMQGVRRIRFSIAEGGGSLSDTTVLSDEHGRASVRWTLGRTAGRHELAVTLADAPAIHEQRAFAEALSLDAGERIVVTGATSGKIGILLRKDIGVSPYTLVWPDTVVRLLPRMPDGNWEEVTAFTVGHPPVSVVRPWTDGVDTVRLAFRPPIEVPFAIWIAYDFDTTAARVRHDLAALDLFWRSHMTGLRVGRVRIDSAPGLLFECGGDSRGYFDRKVINVYYMTFGARPEACDAQIIRINATNAASFLNPYQWLLSHEVGHSMSLLHVSDPQNVMWPMTPTGPSLRTGQIYWMHFHYWGALNSILGVHPPAERNCNVGILACPPQTFSVW
jgi:hypothetical protein